MIVGARPEALCLVVAAALAFPAAAQQPFAVAPLPDLRNMHGACVAGDWLVAVGGTVTTALTPSEDVLVSRIEPDRQIGPWRAATSLPENRVYISNSVVSQGNRIYVVGGQFVDSTQLKTYSKTVYYSSIDDSGVIAPWQTSGEMPMVGGVGCAAATTDKALYAIAGQPGDDKITRSFCYALLDPASGAPGEFQSGAELPAPLWFHAAVASGNRLYVAGGRHTTELTTSGEVLFTDLAEDGTPGPWQKSPAPLAFPVNNFGLEAVAGFLIAAGGRSDENALSDQIQHARLTPTGTAEWTAKPGAIAPLYYAASAYAPKVSALYLTGGRRTIFVAAMTSDVTCIGLRNNAATTAAAAAPAAPKANFLEYRKALEQAKANGKPLLVIAYSSQVPRSVEFYKSASAAVTAEDQEQTVLGYLDLAQNIEMATELEIFRPPVYLLIGPEGTVRTKSEPLPDLTPAQFLDQYAKGK